MLPPIMYFSRSLYNLLEINTQKFYQEVAQLVEFLVNNCPTPDFCKGDWHYEGNGVRRFLKQVTIHCSLFETFFSELDNVPLKKGA